MFGQVIPRSFLWLVTLCAVLMIGIIGCGGDEEDDNEWVGTWAVETIDGQNYEMFWTSVGYPVVTNNVMFNSDGTVDSEFAFEGLGSTKGTGTYSLSGSNFTMSGFLISNTIDDTITTEEDTGSDEDTGTWSREGNTLTITSNDGTVIVLKKK